MKLRNCAGRPRRGLRSASPCMAAPGRDRRGLSRAACVRARCHHPHELRGLFPDRRGFHQAREIPGHPGRSRPRLRRRFAGRVRADHHRSRSDAFRPAVRAVSQSRARVDARFRHRLLSGPPRRGDPIRAGALWPRAGRADHHVRHAAGARRAARRRPRAADALRAGRQADQAGAEQSGRARHPQAGDRGRAEAADFRRGRPGGGARLRHRATPRGVDPPCLDACRRHRDRRPAVVRTGADVPRSEVGHAGHAVQHEMGRAGRPREVRLPRPQDADCARRRGEAVEAARHHG